MRRRALCLLPTLVLSTVLAAPSLAQEVETLLLQVSLETELAQRALDRYREAREAERRALARLADLSDRLDALLADDDAPAEALRRLEQDLIVAAETATARLRTTAAARTDLYDRRERLDALELRLAEVGGGPLVPDSGLSGLWRVEIEPGAVFGLMRFQAEGTLLTGTYVLSSGDQGSIRGTVVDGKVQLERIDASLGFIATLDGDLDSAGGRIDGRWTATTVSAGAPATGTWTARRLARGSVRRMPPG